MAQSWMHLASPIRIMSAHGSVLLRFKNNTASRTAPLGLGINNGIRLQPLAFYANLISETNLFGMAVQDSCLGNTNQDS